MASGLVKNRIFLYHKEENRQNEIENITKLLYIKEQKGE
jgi:hypothetical protein